MFNVASPADKPLRSAVPNKLASGAPRLLLGAPLLVTFAWKSRLHRLHQLEMQRLFHLLGLLKIMFDKEFPRSDHLPNLQAAYINVYSGGTM